MAEQEQKFTTLETAYWKLEVKLKSSVAQMEAYRNLENNVKNLKQAIVEESKLRTEQENTQRDLAAKLVALQNKNEISLATIEELEGERVCKTCNVDNA